MWGSELPSRNFTLLHEPMQPFSYMLALRPHADTQSIVPLSLRKSCHCITTCKQVYSNGGCPRNEVSKHCHPVLEVLDQCNITLFSWHHAYQLQRLFPQSGHWCQWRCGLLPSGLRSGICEWPIDVPTWARTFPQLDTINTTCEELLHYSLLQGTTVAIYDAGCTLGAFSCYFMGDSLKQRRIFFFTSHMIIVGVAIRATSFELKQLIATSHQWPRHR